MMMLTSARTAVVVDALLDRLTERAESGLFAVLDGPYPGEVQQGDVIALGVGSESVVVTRERQSGLGRPCIETVRVICSAWSWTGDVNMQPRRARCAELLSIVSDVLADDPTLGGVVNQSIMEGDQSWVQGQQGGAACSVGFAISCSAAV